VPPRPPAGKPHQWFTLRPWVFDVTLAGMLLRAAPRPEFLRLTDDAAASSTGRSSSPPLIPPRQRRSTTMAVLESPDYRAARERLQGNPIIAMMAAGIATVPLAELADGDGTPRPHLMKQANSSFDDAEARNAGNPGYQPYPKDADRHLGLVAEVILAERAAMRAAIASTMAPPGTGPESAIVTSIIERMRAGESALEIASETGAIREPRRGESEEGTPGD